MLRQYAKMKIPHIIPSHKQYNNTNSGNLPSFKCFHLHSISRNWATNFC